MPILNPVPLPGPYLSKPTSQKGGWPDEASRSAEEFLRKERGIDPPWHYGDGFGERFKVIGLRAGGCEAVFFVEDTQFGKGRLYAAKTLQRFLHRDYLAMPPELQKHIADAFLEEALPWLEMGQHTHIVTMHLLESLIHPMSKRNIPFIFSEYMEGGDISHLVKGKGLSPEETLGVGLQICEGLIHAYSHGISVHRDLKPDNLMIYGKGIVKVSDFSAGVVGTPGYMAPEQVLKQRGYPGCKEKEIDHRANQFAIGLIMHDIFKGGDIRNEQTKRINYIAHNPEGFIQKGLEGILSDALPDSLKGILTCCLKPEAEEERFSDISGLREELLTVYRNEFGKAYAFPQLEKDDSPDWWFYRGLSFYNIGRSASSEIPFKEALKRFETIPDTGREQTDCLMNLGNVYSDTGRFPKTEAHYKEALKRYEAIPGTGREQMPGHEWT